MEDGRGSNIA
ncbi:hypothetical protein RB213_009816 [Colletotrichum asianum]